MSSSKDWKIDMPDHLPNDHSEWPSDPHQVLNVPKSADEKTIRRAYSRLVREFKPEHHPDEFQKIRAAYENATSYSQFSALEFGSFDSDEVFSRESPSNAETQADAFERNADSTSSQQPTEIDAHDSSTATDTEAVPSFVEEEWQRARVDPAYTADNILEAVENRDPQSLSADERDIKRAFWIAKLNSNANTAELIAWLCRQLTKNDSPACWELLWAEFRIDNTLTRLECIAPLLENAPDVFLVELVNLRWKTAARTSEWEQITDDLGVLQRRLIDDHDLLVSCMLLAMKRLVWSPQTKLFAKVRDLLAEELELSDQRHAAVFDEFDELVAFHNERKSSKFDDDSKLTRILRNTAVAIDTIHEISFFNTLRPWARRPMQAILELQRHLQFQPVAFGRIWRLFSLRNRRIPATSDEEQQAVLQLVARFLNNTPITGGDEFRQLLLEFCVDKGLTIEMFVDGVSALGLDENVSNSIAEILMNDPALRCACEALNAFHSD
jgi:hypothetical protein